MTGSDASMDGLFRPVLTEGAGPMTLLEGEIPPFLRGSWFANGPATFGRGEIHYRHWLDGDGLLRAIRFDGHGASCTWRWVRSRKRLEEEDAGRALFRTFGTAFDGDHLNRHGVGIESPVNISIFPCAGHLLAFGEQGLPCSVDPTTLDTLDVHTFGGDLNEVSPFSAHPGIDTDSGELVNFGISFSASRPCLNFYRFGSDGRLATRRRIAIPQPSSVHDFALGPRHAVFYLSPYVLDMATILAGGSVMDALSWRPDHGSRLLVVDRDTGREAAQIPIESNYCLHTVNCFEDDDELVLDLLELDQPLYTEYEVMPNLFETAGPARPVRYRLDIATWTLAGKQTIATDNLHDFPFIDPRRARRSTQHSWMVGISQTGRPGAKFLDTLVRVDWDAGTMTDAYQTPTDSFLASEPLVVPHPEHLAQAAVLCRMIDLHGEDDRVLVFDAFDLAAGPTAVLQLPVPTPPSFHGCWLPAPSRTR